MDRSSGPWLSCAKDWWLSPYGTTKKTMEELAHDGHVGLRFTTVWGDGTRDNMLMGRIKNKTLKYKTNHIRDFIHVSDVVSAIKLFIDTGTEDKKNIYDDGDSDTLLECKARLFNIFIIHSAVVRGIDKYVFFTNFICFFAFFIFIYEDMCY